MKKIILIAAIATVLLSNAMGQTMIGKFKQTVTTHFKKGIWMGTTTKPITGVLSVSKSNVVIDTTRYTILKRGALELADEGYYTRSLVIVASTKKGYKVLDCVLLVKPNKTTIAEVILKKTKATQISYVL